jgi:hypothetical protein
MALSNLSNPGIFSEILYEKMKGINPGIEELELYEFRYCLDNLCPENGGWDSVEMLEKDKVEQWIQDPEFFDGIQIKPRVDGKIVLDETIVRLTNTLFVGLVTGEYPADWLRTHFYFDVRGFIFLTRAVYFTDAVLPRVQSSQCRGRRSVSVERGQAHCGQRDSDCAGHCWGDRRWKDRDCRTLAQLLRAGRQISHVHRT